MIVVNQQVGRLGNQLQLFAHLIGCSLETGHTVVNPAFYRYHSAFTGTQNDCLSRFPGGRSFPMGEPCKHLMYRAIRVIDRTELARRLPRTTYLDGRGSAEIDLEANKSALNSKWIFLTGGWAFRHWTGLRKNMATIRSFLSLVPERSRRVEAFLTKARSDADFLIGIHIRQTDFAEHRSGAFFFTTSEYADVMHRVARIFSGRTVAFVVCSDTPHGTTQFPGLTTRHPPADEIDDLFVLAGCDYIIGPSISSYSLVASMLGNKPRFGITKPGDPFTLQDFKVCFG